MVSPHIKISYGMCPLTLEHPANQERIAECVVIHLPSSVKMACEKRASHSQVRRDNFGRMDPVFTIHQLKVSTSDKRRPRCGISFGCYA